MAQDARDRTPAPWQTTDVTPRAQSAPEAIAGAREGTQPCPRCGHTMPDLKGGTGSICAVCGFKDSCCY